MSRLGEELVALEILPSSIEPSDPNADIGVRGTFSNHHKSDRTIGFRLNFVISTFQAFGQGRRVSLAIHIYACLRTDTT